MSSDKPSPASDGRVLDAAALTRLRELDPDGRHGVLARVLAAYESSLLRQLEQLRSERLAPDAKAVGALVHTLKSSSASVGALALANASAAMEQRVRLEGAAKTHDVDELIVLGEAALAAVRTILRG